MTANLLTPSDIVAGGRYIGGASNRIRVVDRISANYWVVWHLNSMSNGMHITSLPNFVKWAKEKCDDR